MRHLLFGVIAVLGAGGAGESLGQSANPATVVRDGDAALTCSQMADEAATLSAASSETGGGGGGLLGRLGGVARAGAAMVMPGAGLAIAGADAVTAPGRERREAKADAGRDRWNYLNGLYAGKGCGAAGSDAVQTAQAAPGNPTAPTLVSTTTAPAQPAPTQPRIQPAVAPF